MVQDFVHQQYYYISTVFIHVNLVHPYTSHLSTYIYIYTCCFLFFFELVYKICIIPISFIDWESNLPQPSHHISSNFSDSHVRLIKDEVVKYNSKIPSGSFPEWLGNLWRDSLWIGRNVTQDWLLDPDGKLRSCDISGGHMKQHENTIYAYIYIHIYIYTYIYIYLYI